MLYWSETAINNPIIETDYYDDTNLATIVRRLVLRTLGGVRRARRLGLYLGKYTIERVTTVHAHLLALISQSYGFTRFLFRCLQGYRYNVRLILFRGCDIVTDCRWFTTAAKKVKSLVPQRYSSMLTM